MSHLKLTSLLTLLSISSLYAGSSFGVFAGRNDDYTTAYAVTLEIGSTTPSQVIFSDLVPSSTINAIAMNPSGTTILGGHSDFLQLYLAVLQSGTITPMSATFTGPGDIISVDINTTGLAVIGGLRSLAPYAAFVSTDSLTVSPIDLGVMSGRIVSTALNNAGTAIVVGHKNFADAFAAIVPAGSLTASEITLTGATGNSEMVSAAINDAGLAVIGGQYGTSFPYVALLMPESLTTTPITLTGSTIEGAIRSVAINTSGTAVIGGRYNLNLPYAGFIFPGSTAVSLISLPNLAFTGSIQSVDINDAGTAIVGGQNNDVEAYVAIVQPGSQTATQVTLPGLTNESMIRSAAINNGGYCVVGGFTGDSAAYAAIIPAGSFTAIQLALPNLIGMGSINVVDILDMIIPTSRLSGNNLAFANYINQYSPTQAFYLLPAIFDGTLNQALQSAAPTRNAFSLWAIDQNYFSLASALSLHSFGARTFKTEPPELTAALNQSPPQKRPPKKAQIPPPKERPYEVWVTLLGSDAFQKSQHQTPAFNPITGALIVAFDGKLTPQLRLGAGAAYAYTHLHEREGAGHSHANQESLFIYSLWSTPHLYIDAALWGGPFQINHTRRIHMTGFDFTSTSHPHGWNIIPHLEIGYSLPFDSNRWGIEPFIMVDWVANWLHSYKEHGSGPFNVGQNGAFSSMLRSELSSRFYQSFFFDSWTFSLQEKIGYVNKKPFRVGRVNAFLIGAPGSFTVETLTQPQNLGVGQFEMVFDPDNKNLPSTSLAYQGEFGSHYQSHTGMVELKWEF